jgi:hypothetical protein
VSDFPHNVLPILFFGGGTWRGMVFSHSKKGEKNIAKNTLKILSGFPG